MDPPAASGAVEGGDATAPSRVVAGNACGHSSLSGAGLRSALSEPILHTPHPTPHSTHTTHYTLHYTLHTTLSEPTAGARLLKGERDGLGGGDVSVGRWVEQGCLGENQLAIQRDNAMTSIFSSVHDRENR